MNSVLCIASLFVSMFAFAALIAAETFEGSMLCLLICLLALLSAAWWFIRK